MNIKCMYDLSGKRLFEAHRVVHNKMQKKFFVYFILHVNEPLCILNEKEKEKLNRWKILWF